MKEFLLKLTGPKQTLEDSRKIFSNQDLKNLIVPLFLEQLLSVLVGGSRYFYGQLCRRGCRVRRVSG